MMVRVLVRVTWGWRRHQVARVMSSHRVVVGHTVLRRIMLVLMLLLLLRGRPERIVLQEEVRVDDDRVLEVLDGRVDGQAEEAVAVVQLVQVLVWQDPLLQGLVDSLELLAQVDVVPLRDGQDAQECIGAVLIKRLLF